MRIVSFNANGLRSAARKGFFEWFSGHQADLLCVQETKAQEHQLAGPEFLPDGYRAYFRDATTEAQDYTWWSNRGAAYANNVGWRIDYQLVTPELATRLQGCSILREPRFSDHAPYTVDYAGTLA